MKVHIGRPTQIGPFRVLRAIGAGGMAETFEGVRCGVGGFEQRVCVKCVRSDCFDDPGFVRLFLREAKLAASLSHRNITRVVDFGVDDDRHYLALELVEGMDLRRFLRSEPGRLPVDVAALIGMEIAAAIEHAHRRGVVHRDVTPANILVSPDGDLKLSDFGISKALSESPGTRSEFVRGNAWYMAPERLQEPASTDPRSDIYSLGVVLYQCVSGHLPYRCATDLAAMLAAAAGRQVPLREALPGLSSPIVAIIDRMIAHRPEARFRNAAEVVDALGPLVRPAASRRALQTLLERRLTLELARTAPSVPIVREATETLGTTERVPATLSRVGAPRLGRSHRRIPRGRHGPDRVDRADG